MIGRMQLQRDYKMILPKPESSIVGRSTDEMRQLEECFQIMSEYTHYLGMRRLATQRMDVTAERYNNEAVQLRFQLLPDWAKNILREI